MNFESPELEHNEKFCHHEKRSGLIELESLAGPAAESVKNAVSITRDRANRILAAAKPEYRNRELFVSIVECAEPNAAAGAGNLADHVMINRELVERLFGCANALFASKLFMEDFGESYRQNIIALMNPGSDYKIPILSENYDKRLEIKCELRQNAAREIAFHALKFCILHEVGHIVAGHRKPLSGLDELRLIDEMSEHESKKETHKTKKEALPTLIKEIDADTFAGIEIQNDVREYKSGEATFDLFDWPGLDSRYVPAVLNVLGAYVLFEVLNPGDKIPTEILMDEYPHPFVRAFHTMILIELAARSGDPPRQAEDEGKTVAEESLATLFSWFVHTHGRTKDPWPDMNRFDGKMSARYDQWHDKLKAMDRLGTDWRPRFPALDDDEIDRRVDEGFKEPDHDDDINN